MGLENKGLRKNTLVSVITPVYNAEKYLSECLDSVISQTYKNWEMILVDDGSSDQSVRLIQGYIKKDPRIKLIVSETNQGAGAARNLAIKEASGRFMAFLDSDDFWHPEKLEKQLRFLMEEDKAVVYCQYFIYNHDLQAKTYIIKSPPKIDRKRMEKNDYIGFLTLVVDTEKIGKLLMPTIRKRQDWAYKLKILESGISAYGIQQPLAYYRIRSESLSSNKLRLFKYNFAVYRDILGYSFAKSAIKMFVFLIHYFGYKVVSKKKVLT